MDEVHHIIYQGEVHNITPQYYRTILEYLYYDALSRSRLQQQPHKQHYAPTIHIEELTLDRLVARYDFRAEQHYLAQVVAFDAFVEKNTYAINMAAISSRLDRLIPKPTFMFTHSLLELDHWCRVVVRRAVHTTLASLDINLDEMAARRRQRMGRDTLVADLSAALADAEAEDQAQYFGCLEELARLERSFTEEAQIWEMQKSADISTPSNHTHSAAIKFTNPDAWAYADGSALVPAAPSLDAISDSRRIEAFCTIVQSGIEHFEPTCNQIIHHSKRHLYLDAFRRCKRDIIDAILRCVPDQPQDTDARPRSQPEHSTFRQNRTSEPFRRHAHNKSWSNTVTHGAAPPNLMANAAVSAKPSPLEQPAEASTYFNEFSVLHMPQTQKTLAYFLETFEGCRRRTINRNNPLPPSCFYLVDAGYLTDPRRQCKLSTPHKSTLRHTYDFHRRLLQKEVELGYFKATASSHAVQIPAVASLRVSLADEFSDPAYNPYNDPTKLASVSALFSGKQQLDSRATAVYSLASTSTIFPSSRRSQLGHLHRLKAELAEANCYARYYSMLAYAIQVHHFPLEAGGGGTDHVGYSDYGYAELSQELATAIGVFLHSIEADYSLARRQELDKLIAQKIDDWESREAALQTESTAQLQQRRGSQLCIPTSSSMSFPLAPQESLFSPVDFVGFNYDDARSPVSATAAAAAAAAAATQEHPPAHRRLAAKSSGILSGLKRLRHERSNTRLNALFNSGGYYDDMAAGAAPPTPPTPPMPPPPLWHTPNGAPYEPAEKSGFPGKSLASKLFGHGSAEPSAFSRVY